MCTKPFYRVGRTARLGQKGEAVLFLQPSEAEYMQELKKHGVSLQELSLPQVLDALQDRRGKRDDSFLAVEMHPLAALMQKALEAFVAAKVSSNALTAHLLSTH
jgi:ATP-dependent RNA helicase DDX31/DBP7